MTPAEGFLRFEGCRRGPRTESPLHHSHSSTTKHPRKNGKPMTTSSAGLIVSGRDYTVVEVSGRPAAHLDDFTGETTFVLTGDAEPHVIPGVGAATADGV